MQKPLLLNKDKIGRFHIFFTIFVGMYIMWMCYYYLRIHIMGHQYPSANFLFFRNDRYKDFATINFAIKDLDPYISKLSNYPPLILVFAYLFSLMGDYDKFDIHTLQYTFNDPVIWRSFIFFIALYVIAAVGVCVFFARKQIIKNGTTEAAAKAKTYLVYFFLGVSFVLSAPSLYMVDRGNYLVVSVVLYMMWAVAEEECPDSYWGAVFLALCAATKVYPVYILGLYLFDGKFKKLIVSAVTGAATTLLPIFLFQGSYVENVVEFVKGVGGFGVGVNAGYFTIGLTGSLIYLERLFGIPVELSTQKNHTIWLVAGVVITAVGFFFISRDKKRWRQFFAVTAMMNYLTPNAYLYQSSYMFAPMLLMFADKEKLTKKDLPYVIAAGLLMVPKPYDYLKGLGPGSPLEWNYLNCAIIIDAGTYLFIIVYYCIQRAIEKFGSRNAAKKAA